MKLLCACPLQRMMKIDSGVFFLRAYNYYISKYVLKEGGDMEVIIDKGCRLDVHKETLIAVGHKILIMVYYILKTRMPYKVLGKD
jgi:hypothetical protein